jgi:uncharacterized protein YjbI with pentapeptide repeats
LLFVLHGLDDVLAGRRVDDFRLPGCSHTYLAMKHLLMRAKGLAGSSLCGADLTGADLEGAVMEGTLR